MKYTIIKVALMFISFISIMYLNSILQEDLGTNLMSVFVF